MMKRLAWCAMGWMMVATFVMTLGCGPSGPTRPQTYPVTGVVTYNGQPAAGANLNFQLTDGSGYAMAITDDAGRYSLMTFEANDGAVPGEYVVGITKYDQAVVVDDMSDDDYVPPEEQAAVTSSGNQLPIKYSVPQTSGLTATVLEQRNEFNFELTD